MNRALLSRRLLRLAVVVGLAVPAASFAHDVPGENPAIRVAPVSLETVSSEMAAAAVAFWNALTPEQQAKATYTMENDERLNWHFIPKPRNGLPIKEMTPPQRNLAWAFLSTGLSNHGFTKAQQIMSLEQILKESEAGPPKTPLRDPENYFFTVFGKPDAKGTWAWRVEGHHLSLNFTVANGKAINATPAFMGDNPGEIRQGPRSGLRVLATEEDMGRKLVKALDEAQQKKAIVTKDAPKDVITLAVRKVDLAKVGEIGVGITAAEMKPEQREMLLALIEEYARRHRSELADQELRRIHVAGFDKVTFAWAGGTEVGVGHYYRIQGPTFLIEYDNTQNNANHIHTVWRDPSNDFGEDALKKHYEGDHTKK